MNSFTPRRDPTSPDIPLGKKACIFLFRIFIVFVAEVDGDLVGFTQLYPLFSSTNMAKLWLLNDLYVQPELRGKAIGKALLKAAQDHCVATQAKGLSLETEKTNQIGNGLYPKMDFVCDDEHNFYYWENPSFSSS